VVIAGLTTKEETETETGIPLLKDIPILGYLFKHKANQTRKRDLIIFVTPHIVQQAGRGPDLAKNDERYPDFEPGAGVYGDYSPVQDKSKAPADSARMRP
jgi:type II secretory pathway component GspD/PulD (secretin)